MKQKNQKDKTGNLLKPEIANFIHYYYKARDYRYLLSSQFINNPKGFFEVSAVCDCFMCGLLSSFVEHWWRCLQVIFNAYPRCKKLKRNTKELRKNLQLIGFPVCFCYCCYHNAKCVCVCFMIFPFCQDDDYDDDDDTYESHLHGKSVEVFDLPDNEDIGLPLDMDSAQSLLKFKEVWWQFLKYSLWWIGMHLNLVKFGYNLLHVPLIVLLSLFSQHCHKSL